MSSYSSSGRVIDNKLRSNFHVEHVAKCVATGIIIMRATRRFLPISITLSIYYALVCS